VPIGTDIVPVKADKWWHQHSKKVLSDSLELVDASVRLVGFIGR